jgi:plastocyanin
MLKIMKNCLLLVSAFFVNLLIPFITLGFEGQVIHLQIKDHKFIPDTIYAEPGKKIKLVIENTDNEVEEFESISLNRERIIPPLSTANIILAPLEVGSYEFMGEFHQDTAKGVLIVQEKDDKAENKLENKDKE